jgi:hypothetical protein
MRMEIGAGVFRIPAGPGRIVRVLPARKRAAFMMHQADQVDGVDARQARHVVQDGLDAFIVHVPGYRVPSTSKGRIGRIAVVLRRSPDRAATLAE